MHIIDSHFHWWPRSIFEKLCKRQDFPKARVNKRGGYDYMRRTESGQHLNSWAEWFDLDKQFEYMDSLGHRVDVVCSIGPFSVSFSDMPVEEGRDYAIMWNEEMAGAQKKYPGPALGQRRGAAAGHPRRHRGARRRGEPARPDGRQSARQRRRRRAHRRRAAAAVLRALREARPADVPASDRRDLPGHASDGYDGALHLSLGRVIEVSVAAMRLVLSGTMERHPDLKIVMSHTGGSLPYQSGRMDKNSKAAKLPKPVSEYLKRMYTDTVSPHSEGMQFAIDYYGIDNVMYGTDYPCWDPAPCLKLLENVDAVGRRQAQAVLFERAPHPRLEGSGAGEDRRQARAGAGLT